MSRRERRMNKRRQDSWTSDEDRLLIETVLTYIREGKTQLEAFKAVGEKLSRTAAACGFRWNKMLRQQYAEEIEAAKKESHKQKTKERKHANETARQQPADSIEHAIAILREYKERKANPEIEHLERKIGQLEEENRRLKELLNRYNEAWCEMQNIWHWTKKQDDQVFQKENTD